ncbi:hypothetical protein [Pseudomonas oryzihabitans]|nr:hypothetical protein [Pseudomonas oryzihabitans]MDT3720331.1 hypothetical protein [Pseudomonas oryzihabitans]
MNLPQLLLGFALVLFFASLHRAGWTAAAPFLAAALVLASQPEVRHG